jgi:hypothetical protein
MRRIVALATLIALAATLIVPVAALAKGGPPAGKGPGFTPPGQAKKAVAPVESSAAGETEEPAEESAATDAKEAGKAEKAAGKADKAEKAASKAEEKAAKSASKAGQESDGAAAASVDESDTPSVDESATPEPEAPAKLTGIANALSRIMANIERAEARVAAGQKSQVPPGLLKVMAKFLGWLGIEADPELDTEEPGLDDPGLTDPGEGSDEETSTPIPDEGSEEDTVTIEPELEE